MASPTVSIPVGVVGLFIGPGGSNIKNLKAQTGANISVGRTPIRGGRFKLVTVCGSRSERAAGLKAVNDWLASEKVQEILYNRSKASTDHYARRRPLWVVDSDEFQHRVNGSGTPQERVDEQFRLQSQEECAMQLRARNSAVEKRLNKRTCFKWGTIPVTKAELRTATNQVTRSRYHIKR